MSNAASSFPVISVLVFTSVILFIQALVLLWRARRGAAALRLQRRLESLNRALSSDGQRPLLKQNRLSDVSSFANLLGGLSFASPVERYLAQAGLGWTVGRLLLASGTAAASGAILTVYSPVPAMFGLVLSVLLGLLPWAY